MIGSVGFFGCGYLQVWVLFFGWHCAICWGEHFPVFGFFSGCVHVCFFFGMVCFPGGLLLVLGIIGFRLSVFCVKRLL